MIKIPKGYRKKWYQFWLPKYKPSIVEVIDSFTETFKRELGDLFINLGNKKD